MPRFATTFFLAFITLSSIAQKSKLSLDKLGLKGLQSQLSYIPSKSFNSLVHTGSDSVSTYKPRISTVNGFFISKTEVTNKEYKEFVHYVRDSIAHTLLQHFSIGNYIDWEQKIDWKGDRLDPMMIDLEDRLYGGKVLDANKIVFELDFFGAKETISIYPDTLVWIRDFSYSYNEPLAKRYFAHSFYNDYPVIGISLKQAMAFCQWKTQQISNLLSTNNAVKAEVIIKLPSNAEWEAAAFDGKDTVRILSRQKQYNYNFGPAADGNGLTDRDYKADGHFYTAPVKSYAPGPYELYDMKGNVAEWTLTSREEIMNAEMKKEKEKTFFVVKGGGWNSTPFYLQAGTCQFFIADDAHSFIGFRYKLEVIYK